MIESSKMELAKQQRISNLLKLLEVDFTDHEGRNLKPTMDMAGDIYAEIVKGLGLYGQPAPNEGLKNPFTTESIIARAKQRYPTAVHMPDTWNQAQINLRLGYVAGFVEALTALGVEPAINLSDTKSE